ncbi:hypothetical protein HYPSUDRAFT_161005 [Hypholoma sublateritium FD-334 SS-4]|uniref:Uncharacterized protein n=1 Tax=Hypholoma sublateritium (strain FD-334 SS-4) TaxID=945553 RepID=A0A0D2LD71_HYPSF|nr:hypothetical protein HYPSUDRAFT_161005 [Hypholoma sublateritium FD-334 SS-4]
MSVFAALYSRDVPLQRDFSLEELHCYNLPYGALGFISHVLTYYTIVCICYGRKPLWPFKKLHNTKFDLILGAVGIALCIIMSIFTIVNCKNTWQLLVIAIWKMSMSLLNGATALHVAIMLFNDPQRNVVKTKNAAWWVLLYIPGMLAGMIGLMNLIVRVAGETPELLNLTIAFYCTVGAGLIVGAVSGIYICLYPKGAVPHKIFGVGFLGTIAGFIALSAFYSDWSLGIMLDNILGTPSGDNSGFYWTYFIAKRFTMFSL